MTFWQKVDLIISNACLYSRLLFIFFLHFLQHFFSGTFWANYGPFVLDKSFTHHRLIATGTDETLIMPGQLFKSYEFGVAKATFSWNIQKTNTCFSSAFSVLVWKKLFFLACKMSRNFAFCNSGNQNHKSGSFLWRQLLIANYHIKKFVRKSQ